MFIFFFKQKTAYEMRISDWSSDVCSSDLSTAIDRVSMPTMTSAMSSILSLPPRSNHEEMLFTAPMMTKTARCGSRSEEHTSELQSLMRISYAVFCLKKKNKHTNPQRQQQK